MKPASWFGLILSLCCGFAVAVAADGDRNFPADCGMIDVTQAPYNAKGDGVIDDTAAIQKALSAGLHKHQIVYLPKGTYLVSDTLKWHDPNNKWNGGWGRFLSIQGQGERSTIIRLKPDAPGFGDPAQPKPVVMTASGDDQGHYSDANGEGNQAFENSLRDLSIEVGTGNSGAIGIDYQVSNWGALRHLTIRSLDPGKKGYAGVTLERRDNGPGSLSSVTIEGFQYGIRARQEIGQIVFENITLRDQTVCGVWQQEAIFSIRKLSSRNSVPAVRVTKQAHLVLLDSELTGGAAEHAAVEFVDGDSRGYLRNVTTKGYASAIRSRGKAVEGSAVDEWVSDAIASPDGAASGSLKLPVRETPEWYDADLSHWVSVGPPSGKDDTAAIQAAMNAGKAVVYFPCGGFNVSDTIVVPPGVKLITGFGGGVNAKKLTDRPIFRIEGGTKADLTIFDRLTNYVDASWLIEHASPRTLVLRDFCEAGGYRNKPGAGPLFLDDVCGGGMWRFDHPQDVWVRQWDIEVAGQPKVLAKGARIWCLGFKSEGGESLMEISDGGALEVLGGFAYTFGVDPKTPAFVCRDARLSVAFAGTSYVNGFYNVLVRRIRGQETKEFLRGNAFGRGMGASVPLYVSGTAE